MLRSVKILSVIFLLSVFFSSCKKNKEGNFTFTIRATYGNESFAIGSPNTDPQGRRIQIDNLKFYLSHITLIKPDNSEVELKEVMLCNLSDPNSLTFTVPNLNGDFKAVKFSSGVDSVQNETDPLSVPSSHPLSSDNNMYWSWLKYQFELLEARCDTTTTGAGNFNWFPRYHIGGNALYRTTTLNKNFSVCCNNKYSFKVVLDVKKIFYGAQTLDIITEDDTQSGPTDDPVVAPKFADNFSQAFSIE